MIQFASLIPITIGLSTVFKNLGIPLKYIPLINLISGITLSWLLSTDLSLSDTLFQGLIVGLSASGLYDQSKEVIPRLLVDKKKKKDGIEKTSSNELHPEIKA